MIPKHFMRRSEVGEVRPSQSLTTFGVGSMVDLPNMSVMVMGTDDWAVTHAAEITEERLLRSAQAILGPQVRCFRSPPRAEDVNQKTNWFDDSRMIGIPVAPFPRWMVCSRCRLLSPVGSQLFEPKIEAYRPERTRYTHDCSTQAKPAVVLPARFLVTCENGHLDDFPWVSFVHDGPSNCNGLLYLYEVGVSGEASDVEVACKGCGKKKRMGQAFGPSARKLMPACTARRPQLRDYDPAGCDQQHMKPILQGASNIWFPMIISALSVPQAQDELGRLIEDNWAILEKAKSLEILDAFRMVGNLKAFAKYELAELWDGIQNKLQTSPEEQTDPNDLKRPEWEVFINPASAIEGSSFKLKEVEPPEGYENYFEKIVLVEKLREVRSLIGFTRIESSRDFDNVSEFPSKRRGRISRRDPTWLPASETNGEGIFFQFSEAAVESWAKENKAYEAEFEQAHIQWKLSKNLDPKGYPWLRYILLHTFSHALIRQLAVECGYTSASITERLYSCIPQEGKPMAGVLVYTAAPDSEGTLGGLCDLGKPKKLGRHIRRAMERMSLCSSDPLCSEHRASSEKLHGAACHACSFLAETSCERGNKYLDRAVLVPTLTREDLAFFR